MVAVGVNMACPGRAVTKASPRLASPALHPHALRHRLALLAQSLEIDSVRVEIPPSVPVACQARDQGELAGAREQRELAGDTL